MVIINGRFWESFMTRTPFFDQQQKDQLNEMKACLFAVPTQAVYRPEHPGTHPEHGRLVPGTAGEQLGGGVLSELSKLDLSGLSITKM